jgi:hypothetical protein
VASAGRARHLGRRDSVRGDVPRYIPLPKFLLPKEVAEVNRRKILFPKIPWQDLINEVIEESIDPDKKKAKRKSKEA